MWWFNPAAVHMVQYIGHQIPSGHADLVLDISCVIVLHRHKGRAKICDETLCHTSTDNLHVETRTTQRINLFLRCWWIEASPQVNRIED